MEQETGLNNTGFKKLRKIGLRCFLIDVSYAAPFGIAHTSDENEQVSLKNNNVTWKLNQTLVLLTIYMYIYRSLRIST